MNDLDKIKLCAEAMGYRPSTFALDGRFFIDQVTVQTRYDPLQDDAQAMALMKKFRLRIYDVPTGEYTEHWHVAMPASQLGVLHASYEKDLNRAIVECVAKMQAVKVAA